jgi:hypothetical protein
VVISLRGKNEMGVNDDHGRLVISRRRCRRRLPLEFRDTINVLLLGSDSRPGEKLGRADTIIIASINPAANYVSMLSIPRDLYVFIPGLDRFDRINTVDITPIAPGWRTGGAARRDAPLPRHSGARHARINFAGVGLSTGWAAGVWRIAGCTMCFPICRPIK